MALTIYRLKKQLLSQCHHCKNCLKCDRIFML